MTLLIILGVGLVFSFILVDEWAYNRLREGKP